MAFLRLYFFWTGRLSRKQFWLASLLPVAIQTISAVWAAHLALRVFGAPLATNLKYTAATQLSAFWALPIPVRWVCLLSVVSIISLHTKRLHDLGRSGWWQMIGLTAVPLVILSFLALYSRAYMLGTALNLLAVGCAVWSLWIFVQIWFGRSEPGENRFGPHPDLAEVKERLAKELAELTATSPEGVPAMQPASGVVTPRTRTHDSASPQPQGFGRRQRPA